MTDFTLRLAGSAIGATVQFDSTRQFCRDYLTEEAPLFSVTVTAEDLTFEQEKSAADDRAAGREVYRFSEAYLETLALYRRIADRLPEYGTVLMHGAVLTAGDTAYMFTAPSGTGKTTHLRLWQKCYGDRVRIINGDKPLIAVRDDGVYACGTPWQGKENEGENRTAKLGAICFLHRAAENELQPIPISAAMPLLMKQLYCPSSAAMQAQTFRLGGRICAAVGCYALGCNQDASAARVAFEGLVR